jgi:hypothetical protein
LLSLTTVSELPLDVIIAVGAELELGVAVLDTAVVDDELTNTAYPAGCAFKNAGARSDVGQVPCVQGLDLQQPKNGGLTLFAFVHL